MKRREVITLLGGAAAAWPFAARAQQRERAPRIGVLIGTAADDAIGQARMAAFLQGLGQLDWMVGRNVRMDIRWAAADADQARGYAAELVGLAPDVILASSGSVVGPLRRLTRTIPIVFTETSDPVGAGFVESLARPGGNVTGFLTFEYGLSAKWLELLKQIAPPVTRVAVLRDAAIPSGTGQWGAIQSVAPSFGVELRATDLHDASEIEHAITAFGHLPNSGMILTASAYSLQHRKLIITWRTGTSCRRSTFYAVSWQTEVSSPTGPIRSTCIGARPRTLTASSRARSLPTCPCRHQLSMRQSLT